MVVYINYIGSVGPCVVQFMLTEEKKKFNNDNLILHFTQYKKYLAIKQ